jgi:hypothetical protein
MKRLMANNLFLALFLVGLGFASCSQDEGQPTPLSTSNKLRFELPQSGRSVTYAPLEGVGDENGKADDKIGFYYYNAQNVLKARFIEVRSGGSVAPNGATGFDLDMTGYSGEGRFVIVECPANHELPTEVDAATLSDLEAKLTPSSTGLLTAPFWMSNEKAGAASYITIADVASAFGTTQTVKMKRRAVRIDVVYEDEADRSVFGIESVRVERPRETAYVLDFDTPITAAGASYDIPVSDLVQHQLGSGTSVKTADTFYLNPTTLGTASSSTNLTVSTKALSDGHVTLYSLDIASQQVLANKRYALILRSGGKMELQLEDEDWNDGTTINTSRQ